VFFECTYILKTDGEQLPLNTNAIPNPICDMPNNADCSDIVLSGYPYNFVD
jgi:hypothetical protein